MYFLDIIVHEIIAMRQKHKILITQDAVHLSRNEKRRSIPNHSNDYVCKFHASAFKDESTSINMSECFMILRGFFFLLIEIHLDFEFH